MKVNYLLLLILVVSGFTSCSRTRAGKHNEMQIPGTIKIIKSEILKQNREVWIYVPSGADTLKEQKYPVVYVLDPEFHYSTVVKMMDLFGGSEGLFPKMIVVGIPTPDRIRDMTPSYDPSPSESSSLPVKDSDFKHAGGAGDFARFIEKEVKPYISANYPATGFSILVGHSFGGLMTVNTLLNHTDVFNAYIAADPSTWWNHREAFNTAGKVLTERSFRGTLFFYANSNTSKEFSLKLNDSIERNPYKAQLQFGSLFAVNKSSMPDFGWVHYDLENHGSLPAIAIFDGLRVVAGFIAGEGLTVLDPAGGQAFQYMTGSNYSPAAGAAAGRVGIMAPGFAGVSPDCEYLKLIDDSLHTSANLLLVMGDLLMERSDTAGALDSYRKSVKLKPGSKELTERINLLEARRK